MKRLIFSNNYDILQIIFDNTYINDIVERYKIQRIDALEKVVNIIYRILLGVFKYVISLIA